MFSVATVIEFAGAHWAPDGARIVAGTPCFETSSTAPRVLECCDSRPTSNAPNATTIFFIGPHRSEHARSTHQIESAALLGGNSTRHGNRVAFSRERLDACRLTARRIDIDVRHVE
jgi:hypothetical protein